MICEEPECCGEGGRQEDVVGKEGLQEMLELPGAPSFDGEDAGQLYAKGRPILDASSCNAVVR